MPGSWFEDEAAENKDLDNELNKIYFMNINDIYKYTNSDQLQIGYERQPMNHKFKAGDFVIPIKGKETTLDNEEVMVYVIRVYERKVEKGHFGMKDRYHDCEGNTIADNVPSGTVAKLDSETFRLATEDELAYRLARVKRERDLFDKAQYKTGDLLSLTKDMEFMEQSQFGCGMITVRKGSPVVVDLVPGQDDEEDDVEDYRRSRDMEIAEMKVGPYDLKDLITPRIAIFIPELEQIEYVKAKEVQRKSAEFKETKLVVPEGYMERLTTVTKRVTDIDVHSYVYENLGLSKVCQKGRGSIILLYGPPGTGKTLTAEILAERIGRPLIKLTLGSLTDGANLMKRLQVGFKRAKRYRAVLLLDEVDVFIRRRGTSNPVFDENTSVFLRVLEYFDGILVMTTNLVNFIDPAVFSRVHVCLSYESQTKIERKAIWESMFPEDLKKVLVGGEAALKTLLETLSELSLNGREIKTVIQNAVCRAVVVHDKHGVGKEAIPAKGIRWVSPRYFIEEAELLANQRDGLKGSI